MYYMKNKFYQRYSGKCDEKWVGRDQQKGKQKIVGVSSPLSLSSASLYKKTPFHLKGLLGQEIVFSSSLTELEPLEKLESFLSKGKRCIGIQ